MIVACTAATAGAQASSELWPELDVYWTPAKHQRTMLELSRSSEREAAKQQASVGLYQDYLQLPSGYLRAGYRYTFSTNDASYRESRIVTEVTTRVAGATSWRLVERTRAEFRWVNGDYTWRLRERLHLQRFFSSPVRFDPRPYGTFEAYYYSQYNTIARLAGRVGVEFRVWRASDIDLYLARQENSRGEPRRVNALGLTLKLYR
ncbi:MAG: hypothetical protein JF589_13050 [Gemmatimonadetes bacterium]|nr:hypothetical protein [Gemmatimonadota bacterium]